MFDPATNLNTGLITDLYQINMAYGYWRAGHAQQRAVFDLFFRANPCGNGYSIAAGLEQAIAFIRDWRFSPDDAQYLRSTHPYEDAFLQALRDMRFSGDLWAVPEGTVIFPNEPLVRLEAPIIEAQLLETALLAIINHQTLIATKAARVYEAAQGKGVIEFGLRRAHGPQAGTYGARAAYIGGAEATSNVLAGQCFGIPVRGTHAHAFVQSFASELEAFRAFAADFPDGCILLIDTYDTLGSGLPNAIRVFQEMKQKLGDGFQRFGVRLDSGDLAYLSKECRRRLDQAGLTQATIVASNELDEFLIRDLLAQGACIDSWGVGTALITSRDCPALGGVYKLAAIERDGQLVPRIKLSENPGKITTPGRKKLVRFFDRDSTMAVLDLIMLDDEPVPTEPFEAFDPNFPWKRKRVVHYRAQPLLVPVFNAGQLHPAWSSPTDAHQALSDLRRCSLAQRLQFAPEVRRLVNPHEYHVDLSLDLWQMRQRSIELASRVPRPHDAPPP